MKLTCLNSNLAKRLDICSLWNKCHAKALLPILAGMFLFTNMASGQVSESRQLKKAFQINKSSVIDINNKYGDVSIETWEKDSVKVDIFVRVSEKSNDKLKKKMNDIRFDLTQAGHFIVINTIVGENNNMIYSEFNKLKESIGVGESQVEIDMKIKVPNNLELKVSNKFGNIYIDDYSGDMFINMANGKLKAHDLSGYVNMKINFGDANINSLASGVLEVYYSDLNLGSAKKLRITSKTSDITITEIEQMIVNSSRDTYKIRMINDFETESSWTDFSISEFRNKSDIRMNFGDITIDKVKNTFQNIFIDARSSKINLCFDSQIDINFDITTNKDMSLPMEAKIDKKEQVDPKEKTVRYLGRTGNVKTEAPKLILKNTSGEINITKR